MQIVKKLVKRKMTKKAIQRATNAMACGDKRVCVVFFWLFKKTDIDFRKCPRPICVITDIVTTGETCSILGE